MKLFGATEEMVNACKKTYCVSRDLGCDIFQNGIVAPLSEVKRTDQTKPPFYYGGVYNLDCVVSEKSLLNRSWGQIVSAYPESDMAALEPTRHHESVVYGGLILKHFGHFLVESTTRLWWPILNGFDGPIVFHSEVPNPLSIHFVREFFELLGITERVIVIDKALSFDTIYVPEPAFEIQTYAHPLYLLPFKEIIQGPEFKSLQLMPKKLYLSRTRLGAGLAAGEEFIEEIMKSNGFVIIHPERLSLLEQIKYVYSAETICGVVGSAFHLLLFTEGKQTVCINRIGWLNPNYIIVDQLTKSKPVYIWAHKYHAKDASNSKYVNLLNIDFITECLQKLGFAVNLPDNYSDNLLERQYLSAWHLADYWYTRDKANSEKQLNSLLLAKLINPQSGAVDWYLQNEMKSRKLYPEWVAIHDSESLNGN